VAGNNVANVSLTGALADNANHLGGAGAGIVGYLD
jgi:hypothetical protein